MDKHNDLVILLAATIVDHMPVNGAIADGHPVWGDDGIRFRVSWENSDSPEGRRQRHVAMNFSKGLLEAVEQENQEDTSAQALEKIGDAVAASFDSHKADTRLDEWFFTEDLLSEDR